MIGYLRDLVSKSKAGDKYGKFVTKLFFFTLHSVLSMLDHLKISYCRKLCSSICR